MNRKNGLRHPKHCAHLRGIHHIKRQIDCTPSVPRTKKIPCFFSRSSDKAGPGIAQSDAKGVVRTLFASGDHVVLFS
jgi:hypothetical protein